MKNIHRIVHRDEIAEAACDVPDFELGHILTNCNCRCGHYFNRYCPSRWCFANKKAGQNNGKPSGSAPLSPVVDHVRTQRGTVFPASVPNEAGCSYHPRFAKQ
jgi:hypothetical protein